MLRFFIRTAACLSLLFSSVFPAWADPLLKLNKGDKIVIIGNTQAERMQYFNNFETLLHGRFPDHQLVVRNLGFSGDTINVRMRSLDFPDHGHTLIDHQPNVILAFFGFNESFAGPAGLPDFEKDLAKFLTDLKQLKYPVQNYPRGSYEPTLQDKTGEVKVTPTIVLVSPIANENRTDRDILAADWNNKNIGLYTQVMKKVADEQNVPFVDLFAKTEPAFKKLDHPATINGCHLNEFGDAVASRILDRELFGTAHPLEEVLKQNPHQVGDPARATLDALQRAIAEKNLQFFYDYRAVNGYYIYGGRKNPFGVVNFPGEFAKLRKMVDVRDERIWKAARGEQLPEKIDDSTTGELPKIETNFKNEVVITSPEDSQKMFTLADGFEVNLYASEVDFPDLQNPVSFTFDAQGRVWITTAESYPQYLPGTPVNDKVLILSDTNGDGKADHQQVFADGLYLPIGIELGDGGAYVSQQPNLTFLKDTDGDGKADVKELRLHGFDTADSHHAISAFEWGPGGEMYFEEGTFLHSQIESPHGLTRCANAAVYRYEPRTEKFSVFVSYDFANPWGHCFDKWGQDYVADASPGANYFAAAFSGDLDHPRKHPALQQFLVKQWRPTCGCEIVSSRHFPDEMQGDYLLNNCIGFQGVLQYRPKDAGSGVFADPVSPLLRSSDPNFRPVDLQFGPDGALYVLDWFNPLVGHMQHSIRDPNRDKIHGRLWRVTYSKKPLLEPAVIAGKPIDKLLDLLKAPEDRTRYRVRRELRDRDTQQVLAAVDRWTEGLDKSDPDYEHHLLEGFWVKQQHAVVDPLLLQKLLLAHDGRARAAAVRALSYSRDQVENSLALLQKAVNDDHPRVRLEAVRALSFYDTQPAIDIAVESLVHDQDGYLEYTLQETLESLQKRIDANPKGVNAPPGQ